MYGTFNLGTGFNNATPFANVAVMPQTGAWVFREPPPPQPTPLVARVQGILGASLVWLLPAAVPTTWLGAFSNWTWIESASLPWDFTVTTETEWSLSGEPRTFRRPIRFRAPLLNVVSSPNAAPWLGAFTQAKEWIEVGVDRIQKQVFNAIALVHVPNVVVLTAGLSFNANKFHLTAKPRFQAAMSFVGAQHNTVKSKMTAALTLAGNFRATRSIKQLFTAGLSFAASLPRRTNLALSAASLTFSGMSHRTVTPVLTAGLSFVGAQTRRVSYPLTAGLSFVGNQTKALNQRLVAGLSFVGSRAARVTYPLTARVTFAGAEARRVTYPLVAASLSFSARAAIRIDALLTASLSPSGAMSVKRSIVQAFAAGLSFAGTLPKRVATRFTASIQPSGQILIGGVIRQLLTAGLSFATHLKTPIPLLLQATLSFTSAALDPEVTMRMLLQASVGFTGVTGASIVNGTCFIIRWLIGITGGA